MPHESSSSTADFPLAPPLSLPPSCTATELKAFFGSINLEDASKQELENYWRQDWRRFVYTYGLVDGLVGSCLELGSNPYFTTTLLQQFTPLKLTLANYFGPQFQNTATQRLTYVNPHSGKVETHVFDFHHFNIEDAAFPFPSDTFDAVLFCEVLEHLQSDPVKVLVEIKRILKPSGHLILTTPNVARLENVCRLIAGTNIYDPYSGYGPYGRHNREYNKDELARLLDYCGYDVETLFSADVHANDAETFFPVAKLQGFLRPRENDLGQYLFSRSRNERPARGKRPAWLYRSYPPNELEA